MILHAGLIARRTGGWWAGALVTGASGAGKSDLMLRALELGFRLVADDRTCVWTSGGQLYGRAPEPLQGLMELRGVGILADEPPLPLAQVALVVRCEDASSQVERMPEPRFEQVCEINLPHLGVHALDASAPAKLGRALNHLSRGFRAA
jgi:serine kinase of HPr protein (carbohydrate metabolism regulator)